VLQFQRDFLRPLYEAEDLPTNSAKNMLFKASEIKQVGLYDQALRGNFQD
jgi:hypothetical protein